MSLVEQVKLLHQERQAHVDAIAAIDSELLEARQILGVVQTVEPEPTEADYRAVTGIPAHDSERPCSRCGTSFIPSPGSSGRFCSRECYAGGLSAEARRTLILEALKAESPQFAAQLRRGKLSVVSNGTIHNDLHALSRKGVIENTDQGWQLPAHAEGDVDDGEGDPFVTAPPSPH